MAALIKFANNAAGQLAGAINNSVTTITLNSGQGALFPSLSGSQVFFGTLIPASTGIPGEIVKVTAISGDTLTVVRGQEGTAASAYSAGDGFQNLLTAGTASTFLQAVQSLSPAGYLEVSGGWVIQWGRGTLPNTGLNVSTLTVTFPVAFPTGLFVVVGSAGGQANSSTGGWPAFNTTNGLTTQFEAVADTLGFTTINQTIPFNWIAIGN